MPEDLRSNSTEEVTRELQYPNKTHPRTPLAIAIKSFAGLTFGLYRGFPCSRLSVRKENFFLEISRGLFYL
jgi:hypothetical protein